MGEGLQESSKIRIVWGCSEGPTKVSAFDSALCQAGIHNLNLVELSSIVPPNTEVVEVGRIPQDVHVGSIGKVVLAHIEGIDCRIASGLGWAIAEEGGIFVESAVIGKAADCKEEIVKGLEHMMRRRRWGWKSGLHVKILEVKAQPSSYSSIVVAALYCIEPLVGDYKKS